MDILVIMAKRDWFITIVIFAFVICCTGAQIQAVKVIPSGSSVDVASILHELNGVLSPDRGKTAFISCETGKPVLWVTKIYDASRKIVSNLLPGQGAANPIWSGDSDLIAFTSYNLEGHSPLTTTHVCVVKCDGTGQKQVILPEPDTRFSVFSPKWISKEEIEVKAFILKGRSQLVEKLYVYNYRTEKCIESN